MTTNDDEFRLYSTIEYSMILMSLPTFIALLLIDSPFGKHSPGNENDSKQWWMGPMIPARPSWFFFEIPNVIWTIVCWIQRNKQIFRLENAILLALFFIHYVNRSIIYPIRMKKSKPMPTVVVLSALSFCMFNGYLQAQGLCQYFSYPPNDMYSFRFALGIVLFLFGFFLNQQADATLRGLRKPGEHGYRIPHGGAFDYVSAPHFLGEIIEWLGYAVAVNRTSAYAFLLFTMSNLIPRSLTPNP